MTTRPMPTLMPTMPPVPRLKAPCEPPDAPATEPLAVLPTPPAATLPSEPDMVGNAGSVLVAEAEGVDEVAELVGSAAAVCQKRADVNVRRSGNACLRSMAAIICV